MTIPALNALSESFVDSYKTELIADRVWRSRSQLELATVAYLSWFNHHRLHESLGDIPPVEFEQLHHPRQRPLPDNRPVAGLSHNAADGPRTRRSQLVGVDSVGHGLVVAENALAAGPLGRAQPARDAVKGRTPAAGLCAPMYQTLTRT